MTTTPFDCDRTCPFFERRDWCRFNPLFEAIGARAVVNSHTATVKAAYAKNIAALEAAVIKAGGTWLGQGKHKLYQSTAEHGHGFTLPNWRYPLVLRKDGTIAYDDYKGAWGNVKDLQALENSYAECGMQAKAEELGWTCQNDGTTLTIYHPSGGTLTVVDGKLATEGFVGSGCHDAAALLTDAVGDVADVMNTQAFYANKQQIQLPE